MASELKEFEITRLVLRLIKDMLGRPQSARQFGQGDDFRSLGHIEHPMSVHQRSERGQKSRQAGQFLLDMIDRLDFLQKPRFERRCLQHERTDQPLHALQLAGEIVQFMTDTAKNFGDSSTADSDGTMDAAFMFTFGLPTKPSGMAGTAALNSKERSQLVVISEQLARDW